VGTYDLSGIIISPDTLMVPLAVQFVAHIKSRGDDAFELLECRSFEGLEALKLLVRPELPNGRLYDFQNEEALLLVFTRDGDGLPNLYALRKDFPRVPHMGLVQKGMMPWICLFGEDPDEVRRRLTPQFLADRILWWFSQNARGILHRDDQALEPFLLGKIRPIYFPSEIFATENPPALYVFAALAGTDAEALVADFRNSIEPGFSVDPFAIYVFTTPIQSKGVIYEEPATLLDLIELCEEARLELFPALISRLRDDSYNVEHLAGTIVLLRIPKARHEGSDPESIEFRAFRVGLKAKGALVDASPAMIAEQLGIAGNLDGKMVPLIGKSADRRRTAELFVSTLTPYQLPTRAEAAYLNGLEHPDDTTILALGMGALGSQVFADLIRKGFGAWTIIDEDRLEPHNLARHAVFDRRYGFHKATEMAHRANTLFKGPEVARGIVCNINRLGANRPAVEEAAEMADLILDMSASTAAVRSLIYDIPSKTRRMSMFLSPGGSDLIVLCEAEDRKTRLDAIEAQYLRAVLNDGNLELLLTSPPGRLRYGPGCRDRSTQIPNEYISLHAAIGCHAVQTFRQTASASAIVWRIDPNTFEVRRFAVPIEEATSISFDGWSVVYDLGLLAKLDSLRESRLPNETCGIILGQFDALRQRLCLIDVLPAPSDSEESAQGCRRGIEGLREAVASVRERTGGDVDYVGEWHSHPNGAACLPSDRDLIQFAWIEERMYPAGLPAVMVIACQGNSHTILFGRPGVGRRDVGLPRTLDSEEYHLKE